MKIVVLTNGWVLVGKLDGDMLTDASVIRRWGTSKGLGELANYGPLKETILDRLGTVVIERSNVLFEIDCGHGFGSDD